MLLYFTKNIIYLFCKKKKKKEKMKKDLSIYLIKNDNNRKGKMQNLPICFTKHWSDKKNYLHTLLKIKIKNYSNLKT